MNATRETGFTLIELLVAIAVTAILLGLAVPNFRDFVMNNRLTAQANDFITSTMLARSEAIKRGVNVRISSISGTADWNPGWRIWVDLDSNGAMSATERLQVVNVFSPSTTFTASGATADFTYLPNGRVSIAASITLDLCDDRTAETGRRITLRPTGRATVDTWACP